LKNNPVGGKQGEISENSQAHGPYSLYVGSWDSKLGRMRWQDVGDELHEVQLAWDPTSTSYFPKVTSRSPIMENTCPSSKQQYSLSKTMHEGCSVPLQGHSPENSSTALQGVSLKEATSCHLPDVTKRARNTDIHAQQERDAATQAKVGYVSCPTWKKRARLTHHEAGLEIHEEEKAGKRKGEKTIEGAEARSNKKGRNHDVNLVQNPIIQAMAVAQPRLSQ